MNDPSDHRFLPFFLREPVYVVDEPERPEPVPAPRTTPTVVSWGAGQREVLLLVHEPDHKFLAPDDLAFLKKILAAVSLSTDDVTLINWARWLTYYEEGFSADELLSSFAYRTGIVFGQVPDDWSLRNKVEKYAVTLSDTDQRLVQSDPLSAITGDVDKKARLWKCLQQLFPSSSV